MRFLTPASRGLLWLLITLGSFAVHAAEGPETTRTEAERQADEALARALAEERRNSPVEKLGWLNGPGTGDMKRAKIRFGDELRFISAKDTQKLLELTGNQSDGSEVGLLEHKEDQWWVIFEFADVGYVKDDEKDSLKADELLESIRRGTEAANEHRKERGIPPLNVLGWHTPPQFNDQTKQLEWAVTAESEGGKSVNYNVRILGRNGVMSAILVEELDRLEATLPKFRALLQDFTYQQGESYAEFKQGDKVAQYGLGALVLGGAAAGAYKLGLLGGLLAFFKKGWKLVVVAVAGVVAFLKKLITGDKQRHQTPPPPPAA